MPICRKLTVFLAILIASEGGDSGQLLEWPSNNYAFSGHTRYGNYKSLSRLKPTNNMQLEIDIPEGAPAIRYLINEFKVGHVSDKTIYDTMAQARMAGRRLLRITPALAFVDIFHHQRNDTEFSTEDAETLEKVITLDLDL